MSEFDNIFDNILDDFSEQIKKNSQTRNELNKASKFAMYDSILEMLWKVAAKFFGKRVSVLKDNPLLQFAIEELVPVVYHFLKDNWSYFFT